jgi:hypothetical protein
MLSIIKQVIPNKKRVVFIGCPIIVVYPIPIINQPKINNIIEANIF